MNMRTKVERVATIDFRDVNDKIEEMEKKGWYLRGTPQFFHVDNKLFAYMTFESENSSLASKFT